MFKRTTYQSALDDIHKLATAPELENARRRFAEAGSRLTETRERLGELKKEYRLDPGQQSRPHRLIRRDCEDAELAVDETRAALEEARQELHRVGRDVIANIRAAGEPLRLAAARELYAALMIARGKNERLIALEAELSALEPRGCGTPQTQFTMEFQPLMTRLPSDSGLFASWKIFVEQELKGKLGAEAA